MNGFPDRRMGGHPLPNDAPPFTTLVHLTWVEGRIEHWIRFGKKSFERVLDRHSRLVGFAPGNIFALVRWASNDYGTVISRIDILRAIDRAEPFQKLPFVRPGGELLLKLEGWPKVERVLQLIDAIEALRIDPVQAAPDYWRHVHNRLTVGAEPRVYTRDQHRAWLARRSILS
ncbi:DUF2840 domain-containing protein [Halodurantibacterium flavum]|uniref:DUF2840 domain-containing protein n=1 Tax=Halodurantibacterium flavum TaxID=1382802 RepID=A0ABW4S2X0_9RHOB